jgi:hypothetical protein
VRVLTSVAREPGYVLTAKGREDLVYAPLCQCKPRIVGLLMECPECGTVWGHLKDSMSWGQGRANGKV